MDRILRVLKTIVKLLLRKNYNEELKYLESNPSFSQEGEDLILQRLFSGQTSGNYLNIGAHHPIRFSNTYLLYRSGWRGMNVDANPGTKTLFDDMLPEDQNIECAVSEVGQSSEISYYFYSEPALNGFVDRRADLEPLGYKLLSIEKVKAMTTADLLKIYRFQKTDFLNLDVEGADEQILKALPWGQFSPKVICIETGPSRKQTNPIQEFLAGKGYSVFSQLYNSSIFVKN